MNRKKLLFVYNRVRHGMLLYTLRNVIGKLGFDIRPFCLIEDLMHQQNNSSFEHFKDISIRSLNQEQIVKALQASRINYNIERILKDVERGQKCIGLYLKEELSSYMFVDFGPTINYTKLELKLKKGDAYVLNMYTFEEYRGKGLSFVLRIKSYQFLKSYDITRLYSIVSYFNTPSLKVHYKVGARKKALYAYIKLFTRKEKLVKLKEY